MSCTAVNSACVSWLALSKVDTSWTQHPHSDALDSIHGLRFLSASARSSMQASALLPASCSAPAPASAPAAFFRDKAFRLCLAYFDVRRGSEEGHEFEKVLAFYPTSAALSVRTGIVGLAQALASFASSFSPQQARK